MQTLSIIASISVSSIGLIVIITLGYLLFKPNQFFGGISSELGIAACARIKLLLWALWVLEIQFFAATIWDLNRADQRHFPLGIRLPVAVIQTVIVSIGLHAGMGMLKQWTRKSRLSQTSKPL